MVRIVFSIRKRIPAALLSRDSLTMERMIFFIVQSIPPELATAIPPRPAATKGFPAAGDDALLPSGLPPKCPCRSDKASRPARPWPLSLARHRRPHPHNASNPPLPPPNTPRL